MTRSSSLLPLRGRAFAFTRHQFGQHLFGLAGADDPALLHDQNLMARGKHGLAVGNDDQRVVGREPAKGLAQFLFAFAVEVARRFVENQDRRVGNQRPRDRHALPDAARQ